MSIVKRSVGVRLRRWTKAEYYQLGELGFFRGQRVELLEGKLMVQSPQLAPHSTAVLRTVKVLEALFGPAYHARPQLPLDLGQHTEPEPDVSLVAGTIDDFSTAHPTTALLIVEVSDSTLSYDRNRKGSLYARAGIRDYWIVNLAARQLEVYRDPVPDASRRYGFRYGSRLDLAPAAPVAPLALPQGVVQVGSLL